MKKAEDFKILSALVLILAIAMISCVAKTPPIKTPNAIASLEKVNLGGVDQWILIRGTDIKNPVLLHLHGGPGDSEMPMEHYFGVELEKHFVFVMWDQRGAGKSYSAKIPKETMTIDQFVSDAHELTLVLKKRFSADKIYLMGHSWGTILGTLLVQKYPEDYYTYVGIGQCVDILRNEEISYQFVLKEAKTRKNKSALKDLEEIGPPPYKDISGLITKQRWLRKFGGMFHDPKGMRKLYQIALKSPEYTLPDFLNYYNGSFRAVQAIWDEMTKVNFLDQAPRLEVPVYFFEGRHDYGTSWELMQEYYEKLDAPNGKHLIWFENSAHSPNLEEPEKFSEVMINQVLKETYVKP